MSIEPEILSHIKRKTRLVQQSGIIFSFFFCFMTSLSSIFARDQNPVTQYRVRRKIQSRTLSDVMCIFKNCVAKQTIYRNHFCLYDRVIFNIMIIIIPSLPFYDSIHQKIPACVRSPPLFWQCQDFESAFRKRFVNTGLL